MTSTTVQAVANAAAFRDRLPWIRRYIPDSVQQFQRKSIEVDTLNIKPKNEGVWFPNWSEVYLIDKDGVVITRLNHTRGFLVKGRVVTVPIFGRNIAESVHEAMQRLGEAADRVQYILAHVPYTFNEGAPSAHLYMTRDNGPIAPVWRKLVDALYKGSLAALEPLKNESKG